MGKIDSDTGIGINILDPQKTCKKIRMPNLPKTLDDVQGEGARHKKT
jgi:hypothetical protein